MKVSERVEGIAPSGSIQISAQITNLRNQGKDIIGLNIGEPDFLPKESILEAIYEALKKGKTKYSSVSGEPELRQAIASYFNKRCNTQIGPQNILVGNGSKQIIFNSFQSILDEGDEVIVPIPYWVTIPESIKLAGGKSVFVNSQEDFHLDLDAIKNAITPKTKAIYINTPNNPSGAVYTRKELTELGELAIAHDLIIVSDEAYESLTYDCEFVSPLMLGKEIADRSISIQSFSKSFCMTGFRVGYMIAKEEFIKKVDSFQGHLCGNIPPFTQYGAINAIEHSDEIIGDMLKTMHERKTRAYELFSQLFKVSKPQGAFYLFLDIKPFIEKGIVKDSIEMVQKLIEEAGVALVPGKFFGQDDYIRLAFTDSVERIEQAYENIKKVLC
ncbi:pyridoxal phosphate-dependent aminotransferase [Halobacteriovorax sp. RT-2-6]|uniref:pyridoxal phosphate-dependent aminotransferase n=1 Tax=unclassified Halobacteriovorax TaxID=2639665 RepID=UPI003999F15F